MTDTRGKTDIPPGSSSPPKAGGLKRVGAWARVHWKELLAIGLAAIPAAFLLFHKGTQQAATTALSYPASLFGGGSGDTSGGATTSSDGTSGGGTPTPHPAPTPPPPSAPTLTLHAREWQKLHPGVPLSKMPPVIAKSAPLSQHQHEWQKLHPGVSLSKMPKQGTSVKGANPTIVAAPKKGKVRGK